MADSMVNQWVQVVRWARIPTSTTAVALTLASYAKTDGTRVYPGVARVALDCKLTTRTVRRAMRQLRELGLIERVRRRPHTLVTEYRLMLPQLHELREHVMVPWPNEYDDMIARLNKSDRNPSWRAKRAGHQDPAQSDVQDTALHNVQDTRDGGTSIGTSSSEPPLPSKTKPSNVTALTRELGDARMALEEEDPPRTREPYGTCPTCGVLYDPGRICGNRTCTDYRRTTP